MIHCILICFNNDSQTVLRWRRDVKPAVEHTGLFHRVTVIDNSLNPSQLLSDEFGKDWVWNGGLNFQYGRSLNQAVPRHRDAEWVLYVCTKHGTMLDVSWVNDILVPLKGDSQVVLSGHLRGSNSPEGVAHALKHPEIAEQFRFTRDDGVGWVPQHVQGGVFAARADFMLVNPYPPEFEHLYTDHFLTWTALKKGFKCADVDTILSVWRDSVFCTNGRKYVHSDNHV